jgi:uncharacterized FAD-dependent dehydrogenase
MHKTTRMYDAIIIGAGPAGLFAAYALLRKRPGTTVILLEQGADIEPRIEAACRQQDGWPGMIGFGGAGFFIGGRLCYDPDSPSTCPVNVKQEHSTRLVKWVDSLFSAWGARTQMTWVPPPALADMAARASAVGLTLHLPYPARHLSADERYSALRHLRALLDTWGAESMLGWQALRLDRVSHGWRVQARWASGEESLEAQCVLAAPGRSGAEWLADQCERLHIGATAAPSIGVRVETRSEVLAPLLAHSPDPRFSMSSDNRPLDGDFRTYAFGRGGAVSLVEGRSGKRVTCRPAGNAPTKNTSFAVLWRPHNPTDFHHRLAIFKPHQPTVQRLGDLLVRQPTPAAALARNTVQPTLAVPPGDVRSHWPEAYWQGLQTFIERLNALAPGITSADTLVYSPALEWAWTIPTDDAGQTLAAGFFVAGDGAGLSQGAVAAAVSGLIAGSGMANYLQAMSHA